jgi:hypothetical protein
MRIVDVHELKNSFKLKGFAEPVKQGWRKSSQKFFRAIDDLFLT